VAGLGWYPCSRLKEFMKKGIEVGMVTNFDVLLTVHLSAVLVINKVNENILVL